MNRCGTCRWWRQPNPNWPDYKVCSLIGEWDEREDPPEELKRAWEGVKLVSVSASYSDSIATMSTEADFGCVLWEASSAVRRI